MKGLPKTVRVGAHDVRFGRMGEEEAKNNYGAFSALELEIRLQDEYVAGSVAVETVIHELLHAAFDFGAIEKEHGEEHIVLVLGQFITQIIRDNPELIRWALRTVAK